VEALRLFTRWRARSAEHDRSLALYPAASCTQREATSTPTPASRAPSTALLRTSCNTRSICCGSARSGRSPCSPAEAVLAWSKRRQGTGQNVRSQWSNLFPRPSLPRSRSPACRLGGRQYGGRHRDLSRVRVPASARWLTGQRHGSQRRGLSAMSEDPSQEERQMGLTGLQSCSYLGPCPVKYLPRLTLGG
jgi:hypothetical protein